MIESLCILPNVTQAFTGDTLFVGSCGRPDLVGSLGYTAEEMAKLMFYTLKTKICTLPDDVQVRSSGMGRLEHDRFQGFVHHFRCSQPMVKVHLVVKAYQVTCIQPSERRSSLTRHYSSIT